MDCVGMISSRFGYVFREYMSARSSSSIAPVVTYSAIVGNVLARERTARQVKQVAVAGQLGISQSAYSRLEGGGSVLSVSQVRIAARAIGLAPSAVLSIADEYEKRLGAQGVKVVPEKQDNTAALVVGLGLLTALLLSQ